MDQPAPQPVIFLAFANEPPGARGHLRNLGEEARQLATALAPAEQQGWCQLIVAPYADLDAILKVFRDKRDRIAIFHYGGHAGGDRLQLEAAGGSTVAADAAGLAGFLRRQSGLQLVFLNGCSTAGQVEGLLAANVPAVIATRQAIKDEVATRFAAEFYRSLASGAALSAAYQEAEAALKTAHGSSNFRAAYRDAALEAEAATPDRWPWEWRSNPGAGQAAAWRLPRVAAGTAQTPVTPPPVKQTQIGGVNLSGLSGSSITIGNVSANVSAGGDIAGGDLTKVGSAGPTGPESPETVLLAALSRWQQAIEATVAATELRADEQTEVMAKAGKVAGEVAKGREADLAWLERQFNNLVTMTPDIWEVTVTTLQQPFRGVGLGLHKIDGRIKVERAG